MRWLTFIILTGVMLTLQSAVAPYLSPLGIRPDWLLIVVVFFALYTPPRDAIVAAWVTGALADLMTIERLGLVAASYTLAAAIVISLRDYVFRQRAATVYALTLGVCLLVRSLWTVYSRALYDLEQAFFGAVAVDILLGSVYTALWALLLHDVLQRMFRAFGLFRPRYTFAA